MRGLFFREAVSRSSEETGNVAGAADQVSVRNDREFIEKLRAGDQEAFEKLVESHTGEIYGLLFKLTQDAEEAKDLTQEVFLKAVRSIASFRGDADLRTWLYRIAINTSRNRFHWLNRRGKDKTVSVESTIGATETQIGETLVAAGENPEEGLLRREREAMLHRALGKIGEVYREAVILCDLQGLKYEEIAELLDTNVGTVKSRIARGRDELRKKLKGI